MTNELLFILHSCLVSIATLIGLYISSHALIVLICMYCLLANIFVIKQITLFGFNATASDVFTIGATFGLNMLQEYYGKKVTKETININFFILVLYVILSTIHLYYKPSPFDDTHLHFYHIFAHTPRIITASVIVYYTAQMIDYYVYSLLRRYWMHRFLIIRNILSTLLSQLYDTIAFSLLGLYGIVEHIEQVIVISYSIKIVAIILTTPWILISRYLVQKRKGGNM